MQNYSSADYISEGKIKEKLAAVNTNISPELIGIKPSIFEGPEGIAFFAKTIFYQEQDFYQKLKYFDEQGKQHLIEINAKCSEGVEKFLEIVEMQNPTNTIDFEILKVLKPEINELCELQQQRLLCLRQFEGFLNNLFSTRAALPVEAKLLLVEKDVVPNFEKLVNLYPFNCSWSNILDRIGSLLMKYAS